MHKTKRLTGNSMCVWAARKTSQKRQMPCNTAPSHTFALISCTCVSFMMCFFLSSAFFNSYFVCYLYCYSISISLCPFHDTENRLKTHCHHIDFIFSLVQLRLHFLCSFSFVYIYIVLVDLYFVDFVDCVHFIV